MKTLRPNRFAFIMPAVFALSLFTLFYCGDSALTKSGAAGAPSISAAKTGVLDTSAGSDLNGNGLVNPGDRLTYTVTIPNAGPDAATGVNLSDTIDANTTWQTDRSSRRRLPLTIHFHLSPTSGLMFRLVPVYLPTI